jgi:double-stranded uracil-DNA glycosylase
VPPTGPTKLELQAAYGRSVPDLVGPDLRVLLVGINPSLWSGWSGFHFGRPANRLWATLQEAGFTERRLRPEDTGELLAAGIGITNLVNRATARADELTGDEIRAGVPRLEKLAAEWQPRSIAVLGVTAYRTAFGRPRARVGQQAETLDGIPLWVLPNPSGLNAHYQQPDLTAAYRELRAVVQANLDDRPDGRAAEWGEEPGC